MDRRPWRVPVDDGHCISFGVNLVHVTGDAASRYLEHRQRGQRMDKGSSVVELGQQVLASKLRIEEIIDVDIYKLILVEDYVSQNGQGATPDYKNERMGRGNATTFLRRKIWERELQAFRRKSQLLWKAAHSRARKFSNSEREKNILLGEVVRKKKSRTHQEYIP